MTERDIVGQVCNLPVVSRFERLAFLNCPFGRQITNGCNQRSALDFQANSRAQRLRRAATSLG